MGARYYAQYRSRPEICLKFAPNLPLVDGPSSKGARRSADMEQPLEARCKVRWDGMFDRPPTPSTAQIMADRVVVRQWWAQSLFFVLPTEMAKKKGRGGLTCVQGVIFTDTPIFDD